MLRKSPLPDMPIYALTWGISDEFGGITSSAVQRTSAFAQYSRRRVEFLTLDPDTDPGAKKRQLVRQGWLDRRVKLRNLWHDLRRSPDRLLAKYVGNLKVPVEISDDDLLTPDGNDRTELRDAKGKLLQTDYYRSDGSIVVSDKHDLKTSANHNGRVITLFNSRGIIVAQWTNASEFYYSWVDRITKGAPAVLITDSPGIGGRFRNYDRDNIVKSQVLHNFHLADPGDNSTGSIAPKWKNIVVNSDKYDVLAVLTDQQLNDLTETQLNPGNLYTVSNMFRGDLADKVQPRPAGKGIQVSRLAYEKQVDHSIKAISEVPEASLDVFGFAHSAELEKRLHDLIHDLGVSDSVVLHGYDRNAKSYFASASFSLLPSLYEGQGLVVIESMSLGCIPIAYDINYGPASMIDHGVDGFLVPAGDIKALSETIRHVIEKPEHELMAMRRACVVKASKYSPSRIVERWGEVLQQAIEKRPSAVAPRRRASLDSVGISPDSVLAHVVVTDLDSPPEFAGLAWKSRKYDFYGRVTAHASVQNDRLVLSAEIPMGRFAAGSSDILDIFLDIQVEGGMQRLRVTSGDADLPNVTERVNAYSTKNDNFSIELLCE